MCWMAASAAAGEACASGRMVRPEMVTTCDGEVMGDKQWFSSNAWTPAYVLGDRHSLDCPKVKSFAMQL